MRSISAEVLPGVRLAVSEHHDSVTLCYTGRIAAIVAAGVAALSTLEPQYHGRGRPKGLRFGLPPVDRDGDRVRVVQRRGDWLRIWIRKPIDRARRMPGFNFAPLESGFPAVAGEQKAKARPRHLRLVVDNTRRPYCRRPPDETEPEHAQ